MATFLTILGMLVSVMLIGIILLQRGRGGGLVGALSGLGGQSAFGTKAGDMFTRITIGIAAVWVLLAGISGQVLKARTPKFLGDEPSKFSSTDSGTEKSKSTAGKEYAAPPRSTTRTPTTSSKHSATTRTNAWSSEPKGQSGSRALLSKTRARRHRCCLAAWLSGEIDPVQPRRVLHARRPRAVYRTVWVESVTPGGVL